MLGAIMWTSLPGSDLQLATLGLPTRRFYVDTLRKSRAGREGRYRSWNLIIQHPLPWALANIADPPPDDHKVSHPSGRTRQVSEVGKRPRTPREQPRFAGRSGRPISASSGAKRSGFHGEMVGSRNGGAFDGLAHRVYSEGGFGDRVPRSPRSSAAPSALAPWSGCALLWVRCPNILNGQVRTLPLLCCNLRKQSCSIMQLTMALARNIIRKC